MVMCIWSEFSIKAGVSTEKNFFARRCFFISIVKYTLEACMASIFSRHLHILVLIR